ncbi:DUF1641 domain-containing protein [Rhodocaloribacter sp.]
MADSQTNGMATLEARLNEPDTAAALNRLIDRIDTLESAVEKLAAMMAQGPGMAALFVDVADDTAAHMMDRGIDLDERMKNALMLAEKLTAPKTVEVLGGLIDRIDRLERLNAFAEQAPGMAALFVDVADDTAAHMMDRGIDLDERMKDALALTEKLTEPRNMQILSGLVDRLDQLDEALAMTDQAPGMIAMFVDIADEMFKEAIDAGVDVEKGIIQGAKAAIAFGQILGPHELESIKALVTSGVLEPKAVNAVAGAGRALAASQETPAEPIGPLGLLRSLRDPDIQKALGFLIKFAKYFGREDLDKR